MRTFAQKARATQRTTSAKSKLPGRAHFAKSRQVKIAHDFSHLQAKLTLSSPGDIYEREADRVSEQVMRMPEPQFQPACPCGGGCPKCEAKQLGRERDGRPLPDDIRAFFEPRLGSDLRAVRIHTGTRANAAARAVNATAYTVGRDVVFSDGAYAPHTETGRRLLAHELTHVLQQERRGVAGKGDGVVHRQTPGPPEELPLPPRCSIIFGGDDFGPKLKCEGVPGIGSTPPIPIDPRQIPPYLKEKLGDLVPKTPPGPTTPGGGGPLPPTQPREVVLPPDIVEKVCKDFPALCQPRPKPTLGPLVPFRWLHVQFRHDRPQPGQSLSDSLEAGRGAIDDAISTMRSDVLVTAVLIGNASSEGQPARNLDLSDQRVALVYKEFEDAEVSWRVFEPEINFEDVAGCRRLGFGRWSCGEEKADQEKADPRDRNVRIVLYRRLVFEPSPWSLPGPLGQPGGLGSGPIIGPF